LRSSLAPRPADRYGPRNNCKDCKNLVILDLNLTRVGDAGLANFKDCKNLARLAVQKTKVTATGIDDLRKTLPKCRIEWDGAVIGPK
jgi:hypothetical protein